MNATMTNFAVALENGWSFVVVEAASDDVRLMDSDGNYWDAWGRCGAVDRSPTPISHLVEMLKTGFAAANVERRRRDKAELELLLSRKDQTQPSQEAMYRDWSENPDSTY